MVCFMYPANTLRLCVSILSKINAGVLFVIFITSQHIHDQFLIHEVYVVCMFHSYRYQYCILNADFVGNLLFLYL